VGSANSRIRSDGCYPVFPVPSKNIFIWRDPTARPVLIIFILLSLFIWERLERLSKASTDEQDISRREGNAVKLRAALQGGRGDRGGRRQRGYRFARLASEIERDIEEMATRCDGVFREVCLLAGSQAVIFHGEPLTPKCETYSGYRYARLPGSSRRPSSCLRSICRFSL